MCWGLGAQSSFYLPLQMSSGPASYTWCPRRGPQALAIALHSRCDPSQARPALLCGVVQGKRPDMGPEERVKEEVRTPPHVSADWASGPASMRPVRGDSLPPGGAVRRSLVNPAPPSSCLDFLPSGATWVLSELEKSFCTHSELNNPPPETKSAPGQCPSCLCLSRPPQPVTPTAAWPGMEDTGS